MIPVILRRRGVALPSGAVYVGRGSRWGNKYRIGEDGTREEVIAKYRADLAADPARRDRLIEALAARHPTALACWCAPEACHADVLAELLLEARS